ncbi:Ataxin-1 and HBP1 module (AXH) [Popillia japonica]|uniref:Ataxin-1 and HBP1 module (AXH) n=1 Tax=Popillia japonica TaxID=7064 RepID=A0AAW1JDG1_POPJA
MISAEVDGRLPYMTYPEPWRGQPKQPPEFLRPPPKPLPPSRYNGAPLNGARLAHTQRPPSKYSPPAAAPVNLTQPKDEIADYPSYRIFQPSFPHFNPNPYQIYSSPYTSILRPNFVPPPLSPLDTYSPTTSSTAVTNSGTFLSPQSNYSPPAAVKPNQSLLRDNRKTLPPPPPQPNATVTTNSFKVPSGKEGSLKHRILTRPEDNVPLQRAAIDLQRTNASETHRNWIPSTVSPPQSPGKSFNNNTVPVNFSKGSLIQLANGALRKVEDMKTEDFVLSAEKSPELRLENSTVIKIEENPITRTVTITLTYNQRRTQAEVEYPLEHPFFICGKGWASCNTERTFHIYGLKVHQLQVGDVIISLTPRTPSQNPRISGTLTTTATTTAMTVRQVSSTSQQRPNDQMIQSNQQINQKPLLNHSISHLTSISHSSSSNPSSMANTHQQTMSPESLAKKRRWSAPGQICDDEEQQVHRKIKVE